MRSHFYAIFYGIPIVLIVGAIVFASRTDAENPARESSRQRHTVMLRDAELGEFGFTPGPSCPGVCNSGDVCFADLFSLGFTATATGIESVEAGGCTSPATCCDVACFIEWAGGPELSVTMSSRCNDCDCTDWVPPTFKPSTPINGPPADCNPIEPETIYHRRVEAVSDRIAALYLHKVDVNVAECTPPSDYSLDRCCQIVCEETAVRYPDSHAAGFEAAFIEAGEPGATCGQKQIPIVYDGDGWVRLDFTHLCGEWEDGPCACSP